MNEKDPEDEAFEEIERRQQKPQHEDDDVQVYRNDVLEEIAAHLERSEEHTSELQSH